MVRKIYGWLAGIEILAFSLLEGSMVSLGLLVAPNLFKTLASRDLAARVFGNILGTWFWFGLVLSLALLSSALFTLVIVKPLSRLLVARFVALLFLTGLLVAFGFVMNRMNNILTGLEKPIEQYSPDTNPRHEIDQLHSLSTNLLSLALIMGMVWLVVSIVAMVKRINNNSSLTLSSNVQKPPELPVS